MASSAQPTQDAKRMEDSHAHLVDPAEKLRRVEIDVLIPKMMKKRAMEQCGDAVKAFTECCRGRTISIMWKCREVNEGLDNCLRANLTDDDFLVAKAEYIVLREANQAKLAAGGGAKSVPTTEKVGGI
eukprot:m.241875 g.241875  ORF g.241875 m.241875 type:complete len:128 (-) comp26320_c1_seq3:1968-2351(-)